jgi:hypothetical protein
MIVLGNLLLFNLMIIASILTGIIFLDLIQINIWINDDPIHFSSQSIALQNNRLLFWHVLGNFLSEHFFFHKLLDRCDCW